jgi:twinkle protein
MSEIIVDDDFDAHYFAEDHGVELAKIKPASSWADAVVDRLYGSGNSDHWTPTGFSKMHGKFDFREAEVTIWSGVNKHGKTTKLSHVSLNLLTRDKRLCIASMEMRPAESMAKMTKQAAGVEKPSQDFIRRFARWTDGKLWIYDHLGRVAASRMLALARYVRKELKVDHFVIDSLMKCGIAVDDLTGQKDFVDALCTIARDTGLHIHLVAHSRKGENERVAPDKFSIKGAGEIADMADNIVIVYKNMKKAEDISAAEREKDEQKREQRLKELRETPDSFVRIAGQRNHPWEGGFAFWFDKESQQYLEAHYAKPQYLDFETGLMR